MTRSAKVSVPVFRNVMEALADVPLIVSTVSVADGCRASDCWVSITKLDKSYGRSCGTDVPAEMKAPRAGHEAGVGGWRMHAQPVAARIWVYLPHG